MMYLAAAIAALTVLCVLNLLLTVGIIRRLRTMSARQDTLMSLPDSLPIGARLPEFETTTVDGEPISSALLGTPALIGFFSPTCPPCKELLPRFIEQARLDPANALAIVVTGSDDKAADEVARLREVAHVVVEPLATGPLQQTLRVTGFPTLYVVGADGTVLAHDLDHVVPART
ncbi:TlpA disulfide reductase family protein [Nonomuraea sp. NPDC050404]|uniref:TlpA family protein disulfide reductase n=1 Tax=Nonomuraea sp. NPDC050404 TaxID=3155783 RepID=UPI0033E4D8C3